MESRTLIVQAAIEEAVGKSVSSHGNFSFLSPVFLRLQTIISDKIALNVSADEAAVLSKPALILRVLTLELNNNNNNISDAALDGASLSRHQQTVELSHESRSYCSHR